MRPFPGGRQASWPRSPLSTSATCSRRTRRSITIRIVLTAALLIGVVGCTRTGDDFVITNDLDAPIQHWTGASPDEPSGAEFSSYSTKPGASIEVRLTYEEPDFPWGIWPMSHWAPAFCRDGLYLIVEAEDGRRFVHEPPLCDDGHWVISD